MKATDTTRRNAFKMLLAGAASVPFARGVERAGGGTENKPLLKWGTGVENQRKADLGNGTYLNPVVAGDPPDPTVVKDGDDY